MGVALLALALMAQPYDFPERLLAGVPAQWFHGAGKLSKPGIGPRFFSIPRAFAEYVRLLQFGRRSRVPAPITAALRDPCDLEIGQPPISISGPQDHAARFSSSGGARSHTEGRATAMCSQCGNGITRPMPGGGALPWRPLRAGGSARTAPMTISCAHFFRACCDGRRAIPLLSKPHSGGTADDAHDRCSGACL